MLVFLGGSTAQGRPANSYVAWQPAVEDVFQSSRRIEILLSTLLGVTRKRLMPTSPRICSPRLPTPKPPWKTSARFSKTSVGRRAGQVRRERFSQRCRHALFQRADVFRHRFRSEAEALSVPHALTRRPVPPRPERAPGSFKVRCNRVGQGGWAPAREGVCLRFWTTSVLARACVLHS